MRIALVLVVIALMACGVFYLTADRSNSMSHTLKPGDVIKPPALDKDASVQEVLMRTSGVKPKELAERFRPGVVEK